MKIFFLLAISFGFIIPQASAQQRVKSGSFNTVLAIFLKHNVKERTVPEANTRKNALYLDAREKKEYEVSHIPHALFVGYNNFNVAALKSVAKGAEIIVYCSIGKRSEKITQKLTQAGYKNVSNLYGGIFEWVNQGNEIVDIHNKPTSRVHAYGRFWGQWLSKGEKVYN